MNKKIFLLIFALCIAAFSIIFLKNEKKTIPSETPKLRNISKINYFLGKFRPVEMVMVQPEISGVIDTIYVTTGDKIAVNDKIAKINIIPLPIEIERTKKALQLALADLKQKETNHNRNISLYNKDVIAKSELEKTEIDLKFAKIEHNNAINNYNIAKTGFSISANESPNIVKSTINGEVLNVLTKKGVNVTERNTFNDGSTIAILVNTSSYIFEFEIQENDILNISKNDSLSITIKALNNKTIQAKITELSPIIKEDKFHYLASASLLDSITHLKPGFSGLAEIKQHEKKGALSIKEKNILYKNKKAYIEIIDEDETITEIEIETGISDGVYTEILSKIDKNSLIKIQ
ncbi:MAG: efflux RND transporter periplasmic adaptor subunit [Aestuariibaculum sp.]